MQNFDIEPNINCKLYIAVLNKMRYTPLATDALCPMPARAPHVTEKGYISLVDESRSPLILAPYSPLLRGGQELSFVPLIKGDARRIET
jgi:hypothetical protein